jgi:hypothetical protein
MAMVIQTRGQCYDHNLLRFLTIFDEKMAFFLKPMLWSKIFHNLALFWVKNANFFAEFFGENIFKNHNIGPSIELCEKWGSFKRAHLFTNKEVTKHWNRRSDTEELRNEYQIYIHEVWRGFYTMSYPKRFKFTSEKVVEWPRIKTKFVKHNSFLDKILMTVWVERKRLEHEGRHKRYEIFHIPP